jgi:predicted phage terminase large subunit-like protein
MRTDSVRLDEFHALMRQDLAAFIEGCFTELNPGTPYMHSWYVEVLAHHLDLCRRGIIKRLIINLPPRMLKSHAATVAFIAYLLGHNPSAQIICASYAQDLSDDLAAKCRRLIMSQFYHEVFPETILAAGRQSLQDFCTTAGGFRMSTSVGGVLTGRGADFIVIDDPLKPEEALSDVARQRANDWIANTVMSRFNDKRNGCMIVVMQRLHEDDVTGHLLEQGGWTLLKLPAIAEEDERHVVTTPYGTTKIFTRKKGEALHPERESVDMLHKTEKEIGVYNFAGQYQQNPAPLEGGIVKKDWFQRYTNDQLPAQFETKFQSWDTANKSSELNCYSVCTTFGVYEDLLYLLDVQRLRLDFPDLRRFVKEHAEHWKADAIVIEDKASGTQLLQQLSEDQVHNAVGYHTSMDKTMRIQSTSPIIKNGFMLIPAFAPWLDAYLHELLIFPNGTYNDQVDSTSQALHWWSQGRGSFWFLETTREAYEEISVSRTEVSADPNTPPEPLAPPAAPAQGPPRIIRDHPQGQLSSRSPLRPGTQQSEAGLPQSRAGLLNRTATQPHQT